MTSTASNSVLGCLALCHLQRVKWSIVDMEDKLSNICGVQLRFWTWQKKWCMSGGELQKDSSYITTFRDHLLKRCWGPSCILNNTKMLSPSGVLPLKKTVYSQFHHCFSPWLLHHMKGFMRKTSTWQMVCQLGCGLSNNSLFSLPEGSFSEWAWVCRPSRTCQTFFIVPTNSGMSDTLKMD